MSRVKRWEISPIVAGFAEIKLSSWRYFFDFIHQEMLDYRQYIWRGQRCDDWLLDSTWDRLSRKRRSAKRKIIFDSEHLEQFKYAARGRRGSNPPLLETENDWWALGQHYGLATPLLDWTTSPFVAAYFAFVGVGQPQTKSRAIYALSRPSVETKVNDLLKKERDRREQIKKDIASGKKVVGLGLHRPDWPLRPEVEFIRPLSDENQRLVNQGGLFTRFPYNSDVQSWMQKNFSEDGKTYLLMKITIPNKDREACLKALNRMNINHLTLFPDLHGASRFCNLFVDIERY